MLLDSSQYNLQDLEKECWIRLLNGSVKGKDAMHSAYIANQGKEGINLKQ